MQNSAPSCQLIAENILGEISWNDHVMGFCRCPGRDLHSRPSGKRECRIKLDGAATIHCVHTSCAAVIEEKNRLLRSEIGKAKRGQDENWHSYRPGPEDIRRERERQQFQKLKLRAEKSLAQIVAAHACDVADLWELSPYRLDGDAVDDWRLLLQLYRLGDGVWIGNENESARDDHGDYWKQRPSSGSRTERKAFSSAATSWMDVK
jgi:hypothetical protein